MAHRVLRAFMATSLVASSSLCFSCGSDDSSKSPWSCEDIGVTCPKEGNAPVLTCTTTDQKSCKYTVGSAEYPCDCSTTGCATVAQQVLAYCKS
jgi:hypothetical protein